MTWQQLADNEYVSGSILPGAFAAIGVIQMASEDLTGIGMIVVAGVSAWLTHVAKKKKDDYDQQVDTIRRQAEDREHALEARIKLAIEGIMCDHEKCPIAEVAKGKIGPYDAIKLPPNRPIDPPIVEAGKLS